MANFSIKASIPIPPKSLSQNNQIQTTHKLNTFPHYHKKPNKVNNQIIKKKLINIHEMQFNFIRSEKLKKEMKEKKMTQISSIVCDNY